MSRSNKNIDKLFEMARNSEPVVSKDELTVLIENRDPIANSEIKNYKGIKPMNILYGTIAAVAASGIIFWSGILEPEANKNITPEKIEVSAQKPSRDNSVIAELNNESGSEAQADINNNDVKSSEKEIQSSAGNDINKVRLDVKGVNIISMRKADLEKMGFRFGKDNSMSFVAFHESPHPMNITIAKDKQFFVFPAEKDQNGTALQPRFITDPMGNRHLSLFSGDNMQFLEANYTSENNDEDMNKIVNKIQEENVVWVSDDKAKETKIDNIDSDNNGNKIIEKNKVITSNNKMSDEDIQKLVDKFIIDYSGTEAEQMGEYKVLIEQDHDGNIDVDSLILKVLDKEAANDKIHRKVIVKRQIDKDVKIIPSDTITHKKMIMISKSIDSDDGEIQDIDIDVNYNDDNVDKKHVKVFIKSDDNNIPDEMREFKINLDNSLPLIDGKNLIDEVRINKLVPIAVSLDDTEADYIFWFDPSTEFVRALPEEVQLKLEPEILALKDNKFCNNEAIAGEDTYFDVWRACNGAIENLNVYPNPASGSINVSYLLNDSRDVSIFLHDMNGKEIKVLKKAGTMPKSNHELKFGIKDIPAGMYLISVQTGTGEKAVQRIIVE